MRVVVIALLLTFVALLILIPWWSQQGSTSTTVAGPAPKPCAPRVYPPASLQARESGIAWVSYTTGHDGKVNGAKIWRSSGYARLDDASLQHVRTCKFRPDVGYGMLLYKWVLP